MTDEIRWPWMDDPIIPDPVETKKCQVHRMPGIRIEDYRDYGPFRRCGCKACVKVVEKYDV